jgi:iron complex transport system permease protein
VLGAAFVVGADLLCRTLAPPEEIRLGVMTASVGAPFFLFLLLQRRKELPTG